MKYCIRCGKNQSFYEYISCDIDNKIGISYIEHVCVICNYTIKEMVREEKN